MHSPIKGAELDRVLGMMQVEYEDIAATSRRRLLELRVDWSEMGALHQLCDEVACQCTLSSYVWNYDGLLKENLDKNEDERAQDRDDVHPMAVEFVKRDQRTYARWLAVNPRAAEILVYTSADHYVSRLARQRNRLYELRAQEGVTELGSLYTLLDEAFAEAGVNRYLAQLATFCFFEKAKAA